MTENIKTKFTSVPPKHIVEALLADVLVQSKLVFDTVYTKKSKKLSQVESLISTYVITRAEVEEVLELFENVQPTTLAPKHRQCVSILKLFQRRLEDNDLVAIKPKRSNHKAVLKAAKDFVQFYTTYHLVLHEGTLPRHRTELVGEYTTYALQA